MKQLSLIFSIVFIANASFAQKLTQTVRGKVIDQQSKMELFGVNVYVIDSDPPIGATTAMDGSFRLSAVPVGRQSIRVSYMGYKTVTIPNIVVSSAKEVVLNVELEEMVTKLAEVKIIAKEKKAESVNKMATLSVNSISMEQAGRYAGGMDDPARVASSYAGVATGLGSNAIVIRGNAPKGLLWKLEGVEISNPSHFSNMVTFGGGGLSSLSSHVLAKTDFFTGAFPAEYGNALSGVFDLRMRTGNNEKREHAFQIGSNGIDLASEGPFKKGKQSSYLFNYRYSTLALITPILPPEAGEISYQDFSFKMNFPTKKAGVFSFWGLGSVDNQKKDAVEDTEDWEDEQDEQENKYQTGMGALGLTNKLILGKKTYLSTTLAASGSIIEMKEKKYDSNLVLQPYEDIKNNTWNLVLSTSINHKFSAKHNNKTGIVTNQKNYDVDISKAENAGDPKQQYVLEDGSSYLIQAYSQSQVRLSDNFMLNLGFHSQYFTLNENYTIEPRAGVRWAFAEGQYLSTAYGIHSRMEMIGYYLAEQQTSNGTVKPNKDLDFSKAHHFVLGYEKSLGNNLNLKIEPYYQMLFDVPVIEGSYFSLQNLEADWFFNDSLVNKGEGSNIGVDLTLERFLDKGFYYLFTTSIFDSKYKGGGGIERDSRFNKNYVVNFLIGKEWNVGRNDQNLFSINGKLSCFGGDRLHPVNEQQSFVEQEIIDDISRAFEEQKPDAQILSLSINYRKNKAKHSSIWSFQIINALAQKEFEGYEFNKKKQTIEKEEDPFIIPSISYKVEF